MAQPGLPAPGRRPSPLGWPHLQQQPPSPLLMLAPPSPGAAAHAAEVVADDVGAHLELVDDHSGQ